ncbi:SDR family NAD(P)-dependent oxidoreductase [Streptomyces sp. NPDC056835]|uniref:SDR family NAD(P)-dependent oxidoreductase n=1 Tax=Streptomyces sp. NPDC056835 TaxID=3345956 RepID=UPI003679DD88
MTGRMCLDDAIGAEGTPLAPCDVQGDQVPAVARASDVTVEEYDLVRRVGLDGTFYVTREVWPIMVAHRYGRIVVTTSGNGLLGNPASVSYAIAKAGVYGMMRALAIDGVKCGIKANAIAPSASTPMADSFVSTEMAATMRTEFPTSLVSPVVPVLAGEQCPVTGRTFDAGGGRVGTTFQGTNAGYYDRKMTPEALLAHWATVVDQTDGAWGGSTGQGLTVTAAYRQVTGPFRRRVLR